MSGMIDSLSGTTTALLGLALDATSMRHQAIASNIAHVHTPGHRRLDIRFESQLQQARDALHLHDMTPVQVREAFRPELMMAPEATGLGSAAVSLDTEIARLSENTVRQQALVKLLQRHFSLMSMAITEGKR